LDGSKDGGTNSGKSDLEASSGGINGISKEFVVRGDIDTGQRQTNLGDLFEGRREADGQVNDSVASTSLSGGTKRVGGEHNDSRLSVILRQVLTSGLSGGEQVVSGGNGGGQSTLDLSLNEGKVSLQISDLRNDVGTEVGMILLRSSSEQVGALGDVLDLVLNVSVEHIRGFLELVSEPSKSLDVARFSELGSTSALLKEKGDGSLLNGQAGQSSADSADNAINIGGNSKIGGDGIDDALKSGLISNELSLKRLIVATIRSDSVDVQIRKSELGSGHSSHQSNDHDGFHERYI